ncbi:lysozyme P-like [Anastrepha ludens]|uniref:lysozyme P-like n=1 Tax=Anastrepha ludens TaxID=28586 RepID=UPI0023B146D0|nr:lysozyme P-like [Anastrepha ludens]
MKFFLFSFLLFYSSISINARIFDRCSLARELSRLRVPRGNIAAWVCIAQYESTFNSAAIGPPNSDGSRDWGIFQINDRFWCDPQDGRRSSNACRTPCRALTTDNISVSVRCARQVQSAQGFGAWTVWNNQCRGGAALPNINDCL